MNDEIETAADEQFESDLAAIAVHEAGHFEVSIALGIPATMRIDIDDAGNLRGGWCFQDFEGPPFENSCIAWAGIIAENLCGRIYRHSAHLLFPLNEEHLIRWHSEASFSSITQKVSAPRTAPASLASSAWQAGLRLKHSSTLSGF